MKPVSLIGAPTDIGASVIGARLGPGALRVAGIQRALENFGNNVVDRGDLTGPDNPKVLVLWLDAHADFNTASITPSGNLHGMPVACLLGHGPDGLTSMAGATPAMRHDEVRQVGLRSVDQGEKELLHEVGVECYDMRYIDEKSMRKVM